MSRTREGAIILGFIIVGVVCLGAAFGWKVGVAVFGAVTLYVGLR